ncbi:hypothetical protein [Ekhidna sp.]|uniref:hypothetical protein n=1 Tax=Ekhidna sp. TaxID=2608089 RepID=UPI003CCC2577
MKTKNAKSNGSLKALALVCGLAVSGLIIGQTLPYDELAISKDSSINSLKESVKKNKNLIVNTYLLGVSIYEEAFD